MLCERLLNIKILGWGAFTYAAVCFGEEENINTIYSGPRMSSFTWISALVLKRIKFRILIPDKSMNSCVSIGWKQGQTRQYNKIPKAVIKHPRRKNQASHGIDSMPPIPYILANLDILINDVYQKKFLSWPRMRLHGIFCRKFVLEEIKDRHRRRQHVIYNRDGIEEIRSKVCCMINRSAAFLD